MRKIPGIQSQWKSRQPCERSTRPLIDTIVESAARSPMSPNLKHIESIAHVYKELLLMLLDL